MVSSSKKQMEPIKVLLNTQDINNTLMICLIKKWWDIKWKEFKVNHMELELRMFVKFLRLTLIVKDIY